MNGTVYRELLHRAELMGAVFMKWEWAELYGTFLACQLITFEKKLFTMYVRTYVMLKPCTCFCMGITWFLTEMCSDHAPFLCRMHTQTGYDRYVFSNPFTDLILIHSDTFSRYTWCRVIVCKYSSYAWGSVATCLTRCLTIANYIII